MDRVTLKLAYPLEIEQHDGAGATKIRVEEVSLAPRVKGRHMLAAQHAEGPVEAKLFVLMSLAGLPREYAEEFDAQDLAAMDALTGGEESDMRRVAKALDLPDHADIDGVLRAIDALRKAPAKLSVGDEEALAMMRTAPLADGAASLEDGPPNGARSLDP